MNNNTNIENYRKVLRTRISDYARKHEELIKQASAINSYMNGLREAETELDKYCPIGEDNQK